jgi:hypothetical protein
MRKIAFKPLLCTFVFLFAVLHTRPAFAHGDEPRLEINLERINPGGTLDVRGVEFDYEQSVTLYLERTGIVVQLGEVVTDPEGVFIHTVVLPADLPEGIYNIRALTTHHDVLSPALTVQGPAILNEGGGQGERDEEDGLLAPMPTFAPAVAPGGVSQSPAQSTSQETPVSTRNFTLLIVLTLLIAGTLVLFSSGIVRQH